MDLGAWRMTWAGQSGIRSHPTSPVIASGAKQFPRAGSTTIAASPRR